MKAVILSAGQGTRLLPLTEELPKCLLAVAEGYSLLRWQLEQLQQAGITDVVVVTGFQHAKVQQEVSMCDLSLNVRTLFNPFFKVTDNLGSVWLAREEMQGGCLLLNGDTIFTADVVNTLLSTDDAAVTVTVSQKSAYDDDDMKVHLSGDTLKEIGKTLPLSKADAESIGVIRFNAEGAKQFQEEVSSIMEVEASLTRYYLHVVNLLAQTITVKTANVPDDQWCEVDFLKDLDVARESVARWLGSSPLRAVS